jgi:3-oxoadipate enol-lactonase
MSDNREIAHVSGTHLAYEVVGAGPPLVLIHGFALDMRMWDGQIDALARRYQVVRYDMRGFGRSAIPDGASYAPADDLKALLEYLDVGPPAIVGLSAGGGVALSFALSYPELTRSLILAGSVIDGWEWSSEWNEQTRAVWAVARESGLAAAKERWLDLPLFRPAQEKPEAARRLSEMVSDYSGWHWLNHDPQQQLQVPTLERLGSIAVSTLIVVGERDVPDFRAMADTLERGIDGSRKVIMPGVGHMAAMEDPEQFNALVRIFLDDH